MTSAFEPKAGDLVVPLHTEDLVVSRRHTTGGTARVGIVTRERDQQIDEELTHQRVEIERVPSGRVIDVVPPVRQEGDTTIMSVVEEIVVVERRLILKEEIHIRRLRTTEHHRETVVLRDQDAVITRTEAGEPKAADDRGHLGTDPTTLAQEQ